MNCCSGASLGCDSRQDGNEFPSSHHNELRAGLMEPELNGNGKTPEREWLKLIPAFPSRGEI